jgi:hypothetical protein
MFSDRKWGEECAEEGQLATGIDGWVWGPPSFPFIWKFPSKMPMPARPQIPSHSRSHLTSPCPGGLWAAGEGARPFLGSPDLTLSPGPCSTCSVGLFEPTEQHLPGPCPVTQAPGLAMAGDKPWACLWMVFGASKPMVWDTVPGLRGEGGGPRNLGVLASRSAAGSRPW